MRCGKLSLIVDRETKTSLENMFSFIQRTQKNGGCLTDIFKGTIARLYKSNSIKKQ